MSQSFHTTIVADTVLYPSKDSPHWPQELVQVPLSILDNGCANIAQSSATWFFDPPSSASSTSALNITQLKDSFLCVINSYPFWAGRVRWTQYDPTGQRGYHGRYGRLLLEYGGADPETYPGYGWAEATCPVALSTLVPSGAARETMGIWQVDQQLPVEQFFPQGRVPLERTDTLQDAPGMRVQVTSFICGGYAVAIKMFHALADATTLVNFAHDWSRISTALLEGDLPPQLHPQLHPSLVDSQAGGNINDIQPENTLIRQARHLPVKRYDILASTSDANRPPMSSTVPPELDMNRGHPLARGDPVPWSEWNMAAPVRHCSLYFSSEEISRIWVNASKDIAGNDTKTAKLSRMDSLLAHIWGAVMRANSLDDQEGSLDMTIGFRGRLGLPESALGSPLRQAFVLGSHKNGTSDLAQSIRAMIQRFDEPGACSALLHDLAYDTTGQNIWGAFLGSRHLLCTSWTRLGIYDIDFGFSTTPRYVNAGMPQLDGLLQIMESRPPEGSRTETSSAWHANGASVSLYLREQAMQKLMVDPLLRDFPSVNTS